MSAYSDFEHSIESARSLTRMYAELRRARNLGARGRLAPPNEDLLWLPRSAVVAAISALDAYVHAVLYEKIPTALQSNPIPDSLSEAMASIIPIKKGADFREAMTIIDGGNVRDQLASRLRSRTLEFLSYQAPEKIEDAYRMIGTPDIFADVAGLWAGPRTAPPDIKRRLANYVKRRNQIAHEGDRETNGQVRHMQPAYANDCSDFIGSLVNRLDRCLFPENHAGN